MERIIENQQGNIYVAYDKENKKYIVSCSCIVSEERAYRYGESCYRTKKYSRLSYALKLFYKLEKMSKVYIINNQDRLFGKHKKGG